MNTYRIQLAEDLINTYDTFLDNPEHLYNTEQLSVFLRAHHIIEDVDETLLDAVKGLRNQLRNAWTAHDISSALAILNLLLSNAPITPHLVINEHDKNTCQMIYTIEATAPLIQRLTCETALGISEALQQYGLNKMRACMAEPCRDVFIDTSRNGSRRFCSDRCANRYNVQAFRARRQE
ncbi:MAG TPA: CGNR zinc finger domain-containing protein [Aggregatilineales bacterium]|nr:CGNR zinc finger domain-containing protein [Aggregatilineales bacterium]